MYEEEAANTELANLSEKFWLSQDRQSSSKTIRCARPQQAGHRTALKHLARIGVRELRECCIAGALWGRRCAVLLAALRPPLPHGRRERAPMHRLYAHRIGHAQRVACRPHFARHSRHSVSQIAIVTPLHSLEKVCRAASREASA